MWRTTLHIAIGVAVVVAIEGVIIASVSPPGALDFRALGLLLTITGGLILGGSFLALLGPTTHASSWSIGPMSRMGHSGKGFPGGGLSGGTTGVLVSSGTRSLWDFSRSPGLHTPPSKAVVSIGIGAVLFLIGVLLALI